MTAFSAIKDEYLYALLVCHPTRYELQFVFANSPEEAIKIISDTIPNLADVGIPICCGGENIFEACSPEGGDIDPYIFYLMCPVQVKLLAAEAKRLIVEKSWDVEVASVPPINLTWLPF